MLNLLIALLSLITPENQLLQAQIRVESSFNTFALHKAENSKGLLQIRPIVLDDIEQFYKIKIAHKECYNPKIAIWIWQTYLDLWISRQNLPNTLENRARIWNGGPSGWKKQSTLKYWNKIQANLIIGELK